MPQDSPETIMQLLASLSAEQQSAVEAFIRYLRAKGTSGSRIDVQAALDEFVREHSELLQRLAQ